MKKQTALEWLEEQMKTWGDLPRWMRDDIVEKAKAMEKEQIEEAYCECWSNDGGNGNHKAKEAEQYYKETYEKTN